MRPKRSDSSTGSAAPKPSSEEPPNLDAESEDNEEHIVPEDQEDEMNRTPEENKNPSTAETDKKEVVVVEKLTLLRAEKSSSFTPPPALSPAHSLQEQVQFEEEELELNEIKMEVDSGDEEKEKKVTTKKVEKKQEAVLQKPKMKYKKKTEKEKDAVPFIDPNAPKRNRSAYVHFIIHRRSAYSKATMSQRDININLAADWQKLTAEERIPFHKSAEEEKSKYLELMEEYKKTESHKDFQKKRSKFLSSQASSSASKHSKQRKRKRGGEQSDDDDVANVQMAFPKSNVFCPLLNNQAPTSSSSSTSTNATSSSSGLQYAGPIFTPEFMSYNKTRDSYRRQLAIERSNVEHELEALHQHDMNNRILKQEDRIRGVNEKIDETMDKMRTVFAGISVAKDHLSSIDSLTEWLESITRLGQNNNTKKSIKETINKHGKAIIAMRK